MDKHLHIVCFNVPWPADYGGVIDIFYRIKALHENGVKIHLHCFEYGMGKQPVLNKYCSEVIYYERQTGWKGFSFNLPYIVNSRANKNLLHNLLKDDHPVLLEGIHCTYFLSTDELKGKRVFVRLHNVEFEYYRQLAKNQLPLFKTLYFKIESRLLKRYEEKIARKATFLAINKKDMETYQILFGTTGIKYLPAFSAYQSISAKPGKGSFCLYHGNLSVIENEKAAVWLIEMVFNKINIPFIIAGKNPSENLVKLVQQNKNISLITNPSKEKMNELMENAQIQVLPSFNSTGTKLKLLNALFTGRHCIVNAATAKGTNLEPLCHIAENANEFSRLIEQLFDQPFERSETDQRILLLKEFDNNKNAQMLMQMIY